MRKTSQKFSQSHMLCKVALVAIMLVFQAMIGIGAGVLNAQTVKGTVISGSDNEPLIGASVMVQGTKTGAVTDLDGNFTIEAKNGQTLEVSYLGFITQKIKVTGSTINVTLNEDKQSLDEVVVVGYGVQKKKLVTGANINVKGDEIAKLNTSNPLQALQGQTPGMSIISTSGQPGSGLKVNIRGMGTVSDSNPLYIIDGVRGDIASLNPADIESIDVLKDAASAAIYGSQSANGVVLITTKSGKEGRAVVSFDGYMGWQNKPRSIDMLNAKEYMAILDEAALNSGKKAYDWSSYKSIYDANGDLIDTDWVDQMFVKNAKTSSYNIGVTGGSKMASYALTLGYMNQEGIVGGKDVSNYERYNFRVNSDWKVKDWLKVGEQISFIYTQNSGIGVGNAYNNSLRGAFNTSPLAPVYSDNNKFDSPYNDTSSSDWYNADGNPYGLMMTTNNNQTNAARFTGNVYAEIEPVKNLKFRTVLGYEYYSSDYRSFTPLYQFSVYSYNTSNRTSVSQNMSHNWQLTWTNTLSYDFKIKEHNLTALLGTEAWRFDGVGVGASNATLKSGFADWSHAYVSNGTAATATDGLGASGAPSLSQRMVSYFGRLSWNWKETYMATATLRADASSKFARGHRWGYFPSVSAGWILTNEKWMSPLTKVLDYAKVRASWGQVGNQNIGDLMFISPITTSFTYYNFGTALGADGQSNYYGAYESRLANEKVKWETSEQLNIGLDLRLLGNLNVNIDWYKKTTKDWLLLKPIPATAGTASPYFNGGDVKNTGVEIGIGWNDRIGKDFNYYINVNGAYNKNEVTYVNVKAPVYILQLDYPSAYPIIGNEYNAIYGYKWAGLSEEGLPQVYNENGEKVTNQPTTLDAISYMGTTTPKYSGSFGTSISYKDFDFSMQFLFAGGHKMRNANPAFLTCSYSSVGYISNIAGASAGLANRWQKPGDEAYTNVPKAVFAESGLSASSLYSTYFYSDINILDASYIRLNNISLAYHLPKSLCRSLYMQSARVQANVENPFFWAKTKQAKYQLGGYNATNYVLGIYLNF